MSRTLHLALLFTLLTPLAHAQTPNEQLLLVLANQSRAEHNLPPLTWDPALARAAHAHVAVMARQGGPAEHQYPGEPDLVTRAAQAGAHFSSIAENVAGSVPTAAAIHEAWMNSPYHRDNILAPQLTVVGIAVAATPTGLYAVEDFGRIANPTSGSAEKQVQQLLIDDGIQPDPDAQHKQDAHANCESGTTPALTPGQPPPALIMQWESGDLTKLPPELLQRLPHPPDPRKAHVAAVASCAPQKPTPGFTTYRIAVLIY
jgi:Cysteine-rich secretory protein family